MIDLNTAKLVDIKINNKRDRVIAKIVDKENEFQLSIDKNKLIENIVKDIDENHK